MEKKCAQETNVDFHTCLVSSKPQCEYKKKIHGGILEKSDFLFFLFSYENSATYDHF